MKIGIVTPTYHPYPGGVPEHVYHVYVELTRLGHDVRVVTSSFGPGDAPNEEHVIRVGRSVKIPANGSICPVAVDVRMRAKIRRVFAAERFDVVHLHEPLMPQLCLAALAESAGPTVGTFHANDDRALGYRLFGSLLKSYIANLDARIAVSAAARRSVADHFGGDYTIVPNGVDVERFSTAEPLPGTGTSSFNILFVGRLEPRKGAKYLFRALPEIVREVPNARLTVVGSGPLAGYYRSHLPNGCADHVEFVGRVSGEMLARHFASADVFCSPAMGGESFGIVLIEAMAAGAAVVASDIAGYRDVVKDGHTGILTQRGSPESIASAVIRLARDGNLKSRLVESAGEDVRRYSWDRVTSRILDVYRSVVPEASEAADTNAGEENGARDALEAAVQ